VVPFYGPREERKTIFPRVKDIEDLGDKLAGDLYNAEKLRKRTWGMLFLIIERKIWRKSHIPKFRRRRVWMVFFLIYSFIHN